MIFQTRSFTLYSLLCTLLCTLFLAGCGTTSPQVESYAYPKEGSVQDMLDFPQDLTVYAAPLGQQLLLSSAEQAKANTHFNNRYFAAWKQRSVTIGKKAFLRRLGTPHGYNGMEPWTKTTWDSLKYTANTTSYPNTKKTAIIVRQTPLRELPTLLPRYSKPAPSYHFDNFQYSTLAPGMPVFVNHTSRDGQWYFIENPIAGGWVQSKDVAFVNQAFMAEYRKHDLAALIQDEVSLITQDGILLDKAHIGAVFPIIANDATGLTLLVPTTNAPVVTTNDAPSSSQEAVLAKVTLSHAQAVRKPLPFRADLVAQVGNVMMGQEYGWGGTDENRDCSAMVRDLFTPFGLWLPRNSLSQYRSGTMMSLKNYSDTNVKASIIRQNAQPFTTLIWLPGHIALYVGNYNGKAAMYHNIWGIRVDEQGLGDDRHIIGRAVVTSLNPGAELPHLYNNQTLLTRIGGISHIP